MSLRHRLAFATVVAVAFVQVGFAEVPTDPIPELQLADKLTEARTRGAKMFNGGDVNGCLEVFIKALQDAGKTLDDYPDLKKAVLDAFQEANQKSSASDQALALNQFLTQFAKDLGGLDSTTELVKRGGAAEKEREDERAARLFRRALEVHAQKTANAKGKAELLPPEQAASDAHNGLGRIHLRAERYAAGLDEFTEAIRLGPAVVSPRYNRGVTYKILRNFPMMLTDFNEAIRLNPENPVICNNIAWTLATSPDPTVRNGKKALDLARKACDLSTDRNPRYFETVAAAHAELGEFAEAVKVLKIVQENSGKMTESQTTAFRARRLLYEKGQAFRETLTPPPGIDYALEVILPAGAQVKLNSVGLKDEYAIAQERIRLPVGEKSETAPVRATYLGKESPFSQDEKVRTVKVRLSFPVGKATEQFDLDYSLNRNQMKFVDAGALINEWRRLVEGKLPRP